MVRVYPGSEDLDALNARGVVKSTKGDTTYYYLKNLNSTSEKRTKSDAYDTIQTKFSKASEIYGKKPSCWKDYFQRAWQNFAYDTGGAGKKYITKKTGFSLAQQLLMNTYNMKTGEYFDPKCFCIQPVNPIGEVMNTYARLYVASSYGANYEYDDKEKLTVYNEDKTEDHFRFRSAVAEDFRYGRSAFLENQFCMTRLSSGNYWDMNLHDTKKIACWPSLKLTQADVAYPYSWHLYDKANWLFYPIDKMDDLESGEPLLGFRAVWLDPAYVNSLCNKAFLIFDFHINSTKCVVNYIYTDSSPKYSVDLFGKALGTLGAGAGILKTGSFTLKADDYDPKKCEYIAFNDSKDTVPIGWQKYHRPTGKATYVTATDVVYNSWHGQSCTQTSTDIYFETPEPIDFIFNINMRSPQVWFPQYYVDTDHWGGYNTQFGYGYPRMLIDTGNGYNYITSITYPFGGFVPGAVEYCDVNQVANFSAKKFKIEIQNTSRYFNQPCQTMIGLPGTEPDPTCPHRPKLENIQIGFLEYNKNQWDES